MTDAPRRHPRARVAAVAAALAVVASGTVLQLAPARAAGAPVTFGRMAAADRFATAATIAKETVGTSATVFVARGDDPDGFADALAANYAAGLVAAPVLLTLPDQVPQATLDALSSLGASTVHLLGGPQAISPGVESTLRSRGLTVSRIAGADRFATAAAIANIPGGAAVGRNEDGVRTAVLSSGRSFPDALAAGGIVYGKHFPQLLTEATGLPEVTAQALTTLEIDHVLLTGGPTAVGAAVEASLAGLGITVERIAGTSRYETAAALANKSLDDLGFALGHVEVATGESFPDALAGGAHAGKFLTPIILTPPTSAAAAACAFLQARPAILTAHVFGGPGAVAESVVTTLSNRCESTPPPPTGATLTVTGHGWGHGRGMGQFGALGYTLEAGWSSAQILDHFYGNSTAGTDPGGVMTVRLVAQDGKSPRVTSGKPFSVGSRVLGAGDAAWVTNDAGVWTLHVATAASGGCTGAESITEPVVGDPVFAGTPDPGDDLTAMLAVCDDGSGQRRFYRGGFRSAIDAGALRFVNIVGLEAYLRGVVPRESPASWPAPALQAQAVAARSYAVSENRYAYAKTCDTTSCQVYGGAGSGTTSIEPDSTDAAIAATAGVVRRMNATGAVARTEFSSSTGGHTAGGTFASVPDDGDDTPSNPNHNWTKTLDAAAVGAHYGVGALQSVEVIARSTADGGRRAANVRITGATGSVERTGDQFRSDWDLKSTWYAITLSA